MIYGTKIVYRYNDEVPVVNELGETQFGENGDFLTETKEIKLELCFTAQTYIIYKNYTAKDLMADMYKATQSSRKEYEKSKDVISKVQNKDEDLTEEDIEILSNLGFDDIKMFFRNVTVAMIATNKYPQKYSYQEINEMIPDGLFEDEGFINELWALLQFGIKKKVSQMHK